VTPGGQDGLAELAALHGIHTSYTDVDGVGRQADPTVIFALLQALGVPLEHPEDATALLRDQEIGALRRQLEPVVVYRMGRGEPISATLPDGTEPGSVWLALELEDGTTSRCQLTTAVTGFTTGEGVGGNRYASVQFDLDAVALRPLPPGYHRLTLEGAGSPESALVLAAPDCPDGPREWGAFLPLHALRTEQDPGIGTYSDLARLGDWVASLGGGLVGTLPLYPAFPGPPFDPSPYLPVSRLAYNELFIDPFVLPEYEGTPEARTPVPMDGQLSRPPSAPPMVDYEEIAGLRRQQLEPLARAVCSGAFPDRRRRFEEFATAHPELVAYAEFRAGQEGAARAGKPEPSAVSYHLYTQWAASEQLGAAGHHGGRYADLPVGSHPRGFDPVWSPESFVPGVQGGSPPDRFFAGGQSWGFRPLHPERIREDGYRFFSAALRRAFLHADCLRIDHVMGLQRLYMIPDGRDATDGAYVSYRAEELHALVALEAHRAGAVVVGEDLGTVPAGVRRRMARDHMLRTWVFQFESTPEEPLPRPASNFLASLGTHDLPRFGAYLWGEDIDEREGNGTLSSDQAEEERTTRARWRRRLFHALGVPADTAPGLVTARALREILRHLARSDAKIVLVDLEEMWDERRAQNHPGTESAGNWRRRARRTLEDFSSDPEINRTLSELTAIRAS
jgi:4-alpha-glucanotransferase